MKFHSYLILIVLFTIHFEYSKALNAKEAPKYGKEVSKLQKKNNKLKVTNRKIKKCF